MGPLRFLVVAVGIGLVACTSPAAAPAPPAAAPPAAPARTDGAAPQAAAPAAASVQAEMDKLVAAAKQEGKLVISAPSGELYREALGLFTKEYPEIKMDYTPFNARDFWPRVRNERAGSLYLWDLRVGGVDVEAYRARDDGILTPIPPLLIDPEFKDESKFLGGFKGIYADKERQYVYAFNTSLAGGTVVNRDTIPESDLPSEKELIDPRFKGKMVMQDPRGGAGLARITAYVKAYGDDHARQLLANQDIAISGDKRQMGEWVVRSRYPIALGLGSDTLVFFHREGLGLNVKNLPGVEAPSIDTIQIIDKGPNPNATKLFLNWLLTKRVQEHVASIVKQNSTRLDVAPVDPEGVLDPKKFDEYFFTQREEFLPFRDRAAAIVGEYVKQ